jgi:hypothetical protein
MLFCIKVILSLNQFRKIGLEGDTEWDLFVEAPKI